MIDERKLVCINGRMTSESDLNVWIPDEYKDEIYSVKYANYEELSKVLMFAHCAMEGQRYGFIHQYEMDDREVHYHIKRLAEKNGRA